MAWFTQRGYNNHRGRERSRAFGRSGWSTAVVIAVLLLTFGVLWRAHQRARFHRLTTPIIPQTTSVPMPGGQEAMLLSRVALVNNAEPEFTSATVLPGIGMQLLQATVAVPDQATQDLLASVSLSDASRIPVTGVNSALFHLRVSPRHLQDKSTGDDLIGFVPASDTHNQTLVDGGQASGSFQGTGTKAGVSGTIEVTLSGRQIDILAQGINSTHENRFVTFEWCPRFAAPDGDLNRLGLFVPLRTRAGAANTNGAGPADFSTGDGRPVGTVPFDLRFANLDREFLGEGGHIRLNEAGRYLLRIKGMGNALRSVHVQNDPGTHSLLLGFSSGDPSADAEDRDQMLKPGQTLQWHLRLEVMPLKTAQTPDSFR